MRRSDLMYMILEIVAIFVLLIEHSVLHLEYAFELMIMCSTVSLIHLIKILLPFAITITYEDVE